MEADLFGGIGGGITLKDKIDCVVREIGMRKRVYPRWIESGRLTPAKAAREIAVMEAILADLQAQKI